MSDAVNESVFVNPRRDEQAATSAPTRKGLKQHRRAATITRWLRKTHLYVGLWGAVLGLLFGATGILLNHRSILKIPIEKTVQKTALLALPDRAFKDEKEMVAWLMAELKFTPTAEPRVKANPSKKVIWNDREVMQPAQWTFNLHSPHKAFNAEYFVGNRFIKLDTIDATPIGTMTRLHMAAGVSVFWVLLSDTIAGGFIVLSITGLLLWSRLNRVKLIAVGTSVTALFSAVWFMWASL